MKVAVCADGQNLGSMVSPIFGRCPFFVIAETDDEKIENFEVVENTAMEKSSGAGTAAVQLIGDKKVDVVISGGVGPKAYRSLNQWDIDIFEAEPGTVETNIKKLLTSVLNKVEKPTRPTGAGSARGN